MKRSMGKIMGNGKVIDREDELERFSSDYSLVPSKRPGRVLQVKDAEEVLNGVLQLNEEGIPIYPSSSKVHFYGGTIPRREGAVVMDLSEMNKIHEIDEMNHWVH